ncbi:MAG: hypothetical protein H6R40_1563 [Gemmatimonadetes bacterium]|nr:hypothetical protein [Gemmatimonadota bacterium]
MTDALGSDAGWSGHRAFAIVEPNLLPWRIACCPIRSIPPSSTSRSSCPCCSRSSPPAPSSLPAAARQSGPRGSGWLAERETGEQQEERVEEVVSEAPLDTHQDRATFFLYLAAGTLVLAGAGLARGKVGQAGRVAAAVAALALLPAGYLVGHSGGELVYKYGAAQAYSSATPVSGESRQVGVANLEKDTDRDDEE